MFLGEITKSEVHSGECVRPVIGAGGRESTTRCREREKENVLWRAKGKYRLTKKKNSTSGFAIGHRRKMLTEYKLENGFFQCKNAFQYSS